MNFSNVQRSMFLVMAIFSLVLFWGGSCGGGDSTPGAYSYNAAISTMGGTYTSNVIDINYYVSVTTNKPGSVPLAPGFGDVYSLVEYSTNSGVRYQLCHNTAGHPGDYFSFLEAPSTQEGIFHWDVDRDLGVGADVDSCMVRVRVFHASDDPCSDPPMDVEVSEEFIISLGGGGGSICGDAPAIITEGVDDATDELAYNFTFESTGGYGDLTWSLGTEISNAMVTGLSLTPYGILTGTPVVQGAYKGSNLQLDLDVWVTDSCPEGARSDNAVFPMTIFPQEPVCAAPPEFDPGQSLPDGTEDVYYDYELLLLEQGEGSLTFTITMGVLPDGLDLNSGDGIVSGTPATGTAGLYPVTFLVTDSCETPQTDSISLELTIIAPVVECDPAPVITTEGLADGVQGDPYEITMVATDGHGVLAWELLGTLPAGLTFTTAGVLSGTPTEHGTFPGLVVTVIDSCPEAQSDTEEFSLFIEEAAPVCADPPVITTYELTAGVEGQTGYSFTLEADDGELPLVWTLEVGTLPTSLTLGTDGVISGDIDCGQTGDFLITVRATDSCDPVQYDEEEFTLYVGPQTCDLFDIDDAQEVPDAMIGQMLMYMVVYTGGFGDITWELTSGELPSGVEFMFGRLMGIPDVGTEGIFPVTIRGTDSCCTPQTDEFSFTLTVLPLSRCLETPVETATLCIDCPALIPYAGMEDVPLYMVQPMMTMQYPADIEIVITFDETLVSIIGVSPGPIVEEIMGFESVIGANTITITYFGMPIGMTGVFCYMRMNNINEGATTPFTPEITVNVFNDEFTMAIDSLTDTCEINVEGGV